MASLLDALESKLQVEEGNEARDEEVEFNFVLFYSYCSSQHSALAKA